MVSGLEDILVLDRFGMLETGLLRQLFDQPLLLGTELRGSAAPLGSSPAFPAALCRSPLLLSAAPHGSSPPPPAVPFLSAFVPRL